VSCQVRECFFMIGAAQDCLRYFGCRNVGAPWLK
jgi:hypothetical protein